jgi:3-phosphoglycerate kinase
MPTLRYLIENGAKVVLQPGWIGRPSGVEPEKSVVPVYLYIKKRLREAGLLKHGMLFAPGELEGEKKSIARNFTAVQNAILKLQEGQVLVLENPRFDPQYDKGDENYAKMLSGMVNLYVADDFAQRHRPASDIVPMARYLPRYAGIQLDEEMKYAGKIAAELRKEKRKPFVFIVAGKKIETKPGVVSKITVALKLLDRMKNTDKVLIGGAVAYTFMIAERYLEKVKTNEVDTVPQNEMRKIIGDSYAPWEEIYEQVTQAGKVILKAREKGIPLIIPMDHTIMKGKAIKKSQKTIPPGWQAVDIGKKTIDKFSRIIEGAGFVVMSGPVGMFDKKIPEAAEGSIAIAKSMGRATKKGVVTISAGGESTLLINQTGVKVSHASIGGGSTLEFIEKGTLPGIEALKS